MVEVVLAMLLLLPLLLILLLLMILIYLHLHLLMILIMMHSLLMYMNRAAQKPHGYRLMLGDYSQVGLV